MPASIPYLLLHAVIAWMVCVLAALMLPIWLHVSLLLLEVAIWYEIDSFLLGNMLINVATSCGFKLFRSGP